MESSETTGRIQDCQELYEHESLLEYKDEVNTPIVPTKLMFPLPNSGMRWMMKIRINLVLDAPRVQSV